MSPTIKRLIIVVIVLAAIFMGLRIWARIYPDWLWFSSESINLSSVFMTMLKTKLALGIGFGALSLVLTLGNAFLLWKFALSKAPEDNTIPIGGGQFTLGRRLLIGAVIVICIIFSVVAGTSAIPQWEPYLRFVNSNGLSFEQIAPKDPIFNKDIAYYVFRMPFLRFVRSSLFVTFLFLTLGTGAVYALFGGFSAGNTKIKLSRPLRAHLFALCSVTFLLLAWGRIFSMYELLATETTARHGWVYGVGFTDAAARVPVQKLLMYIGVLSAVLFFISIFTRKTTWLSIGSVGLFILVAFVGGLMYPWFVQRFRVEPQEFDKESKYIGYNIEYTRKAYNLDKIEPKAYEGTGELTLEDITQNRAVMENIRLWDWRPLRDTFKQLEARRPQYDFVDVDIDRYMLDGQVHQVMLSARELIFSKVARESQTWVNRTFRYTHGHGLTMIPVSKIEPGGLPRMYINDIPPKVHGAWSQDIERPEIYYGEGEKVSFRSELGKLPYIITDPAASEPQEFDYPKEEEQGASYTTYKGDGGIPLTSFWRRLAYALRYSADMRNILFSGNIKETSRILLHRSISARVRAIAPFFKYDKDPYLVVSEGKLYWIQDAYTTTHMFPYSEPMVMETTEVVQFGQQRGYRRRRQRVWGNYIRNSVKIVIDAYNGSVKYYSMIKEDGQADPIAECYGKMFPDLFKDYKEMPDDLKKHIRYPLTMFLIQAEKYKAYHMDNPRQFYDKEDLWQVATEQFQTQTGEASGEQPVEPYYVILQLPGSEKEEFMLMLPFTPAGKPNMRAWLAAKCDPGEDGDLGEYGNLLVYNLPKGKELIDGTIQIERYIDQKPEMSEKLTLWGRGGSIVIRGNMLAIPIKESMLYVEPIYIQAEGGGIPQLKKVVVALGRERLEWGDDLESALIALYGPEIAQRTEDIDDGKEPPPLAAGASESQKLARQALDHYSRAQGYMRANDWARYGEEMKKVEETLKLLQAEESQ